MSSNMRYEIERPANEPVSSFRPGSGEKAELKRELTRLKGQEVEIPLIIGGEEVRTGNLAEIRVPHDHQHILGRYHLAGEKEVRRAVEAAREAKADWERTPWEKRAAIFQRAAALLAGPYRAQINAATMLGQSKNAFQAEIDAACEFIDFLRYNVHFMSELYREQPDSTTEIINRMEYRPLEGFVFAVPPFNFTSIAGNLPTAPAIMGNTVLWKPASSAVYSNYFVMKLLEEAGLPHGVINFIPGPGSEIGPHVLNSPDLAGIHFTGSVKVLNSMFREVGENIERYKTYPRIVGETGGKDFVFAHSSADLDELATALIRGAFEYQGQKCSAASRVYIPESLWDELEVKLVETTAELKMGGVEDFRNFVNAVIDEKAFDSIAGYIDYARESEDARILAGGGYDKSRGYFIEPTIVLTTDPGFKLMEEEIFGPVLTVFVYQDNDYEEMLKLCDQTSPYGLTGSIFAREQEAVLTAQDILKHSAGNFYINDKPTGAVVGMQPFGGSRKSGTNDKAGSKLNLLRWVSPRAIKENLLPARSYKYPFMEEE